MEAAFTGTEDIVDWGSILFYILDGLVEGVMFFRGAFAPGEVAVLVGSSEETHAGVLGVGIIDGEPAGDSFTWGERPVAGVLMPGNAFAIPGHFAEEMRAPAYDIRPQKVLHTGGNFRMGE